jgi:hypothetical protein
MNLPYDLNAVNVLPDSGKLTGVLTENRRAAFGVPPSINRRHATTTVYRAAASAIDQHRDNGCSGTS